MTLEDISYWTLLIGILAIIVAIVMPFVGILFQEWLRERKQKGQNNVNNGRWYQVATGKVWLLFTSKEFTVNVGVADRIRLTVNGTSSIELKYSVYNNGAPPNLRRDQGKRYRRKWSPIIEILDSNNKNLTFRCTTRFFFFLTRIYYSVEKMQPSVYFAGSMGDMFSIKPDVPSTQPSIVGWPHNQYLK